MFGRIVTAEEAQAWRDMYNNCKGNGYVYNPHNLNDTILSKLGKNWQLWEKFLGSLIVKGA